MSAANKLDFSKLAGRNFPVFPLWGAVYVDKNADVFTALGLIAYDNVTDAVASWQSGTALAEYGTPSATNPGMILIGVGQFDITASTLVTATDLHFQGSSKYATILKATGTITGNVFIDVRGARAQFSDMTLDGAGFAANYGILNQSGNATNVKITNLRFLNFTGNAIDLGGGNASELVVESCEFISSVQGVPVINFAGTYSGSTNIQDCEFDIAGGGILIDIAPNGTVEAVIKDCTMRNTAAAGINQQNTTNFIGRIENTSIVCAGQCISFEGAAKFMGCYFLSTSGNAHAVVLNSNGTIFHSSRILGNGTGLAISGSSFSTEVTNCAVRNPNGDTPGSWTDAAVTPTSNAYNAELLATTTA